jgi:mannose-6-phosphate isomerase-like protein (cupin superfamily)
MAAPAPGAKAMADGRGCWCYRPAWIRRIGMEAAVMDKVSLVNAFAGFSDTWSPKVAGDVNDFQVKLAKLAGPFEWHHHDQEDELFLVWSGRLLMHFRDRTVELDPGEFLVVPHGVEHLPEAPDGVCEVVLLEPAGTVNTGNVTSDRTVSAPERIA